MNKILGIGNALVDILMQIGNDKILQELKLPKGSMQLIDQTTAIEIEKFTNKFSKEIAAGGSAANTINGLAKLGVECGYIGKIGNDLFGKLFSENLKANNIEAHLYTGTVDTGRANTFISRDGERTFGTFLGSAVELGADDLSDEIFNQYQFLHIEGYLVFNHDLIERALSIAKSKNLKISLDMASFNVVEANLDFLREAVKNYVDVVFANEEEAKAFTGKEPEAALDEIAEMSEIAVVKVGEHGSLIKSGDKKYFANAISASCIDTTGAGDLYAAGFLYGLTENLPLDQCGQIGSVLGGNVIEVIGATMNDDRWDNIRSGLMQAKKTSG